MTLEGGQQAPQRLPSCSGAHMTAMIKPMPGQFRSVELEDERLANHSCSGRVLPSPGEIREIFLGQKHSLGLKKGREADEQDVDWFGVGVQRRTDLYTQIISAELCGCCRGSWYPISIVEPQSGVSMTAISCSDIYSRRSCYATLVKVGSSHPRSGKWFGDHAVKSQALLKFLHTCDLPPALLSRCCRQAKQLMSWRRPAMHPIVMEVDKPQNGN
ncbi:hypothetical protein DL93DRAFT_2098065 [Clavulina sp. PMI_390]|nr:hypothetical protein DL93DRAFT_2098065 [Clavulina sp. PMI_390]